MSAGTFAIRVFCSNYLKTARGVHCQDCGESGMTLRIEKSLEGRKTIFRISGGIASEQLEELKAEMAGGGGAGGRGLEKGAGGGGAGGGFFNACEGEGKEHPPCSLFKRE